MQPELRTFLRQKCGRPFVARSQYEGYDIALTKACRVKDHYALQLYECENCDNRNVLYWCHGR